MHDVKIRSKSDAAKLNAGEVIREALASVRSLAASARRYDGDSSAKGVQNHAVRQKRAAFLSLWTPHLGLRKAALIFDDMARCLS